MSEDTARPLPLRAPRLGLSGKLLVLTILFVMIAEVLIYVPSMANFRVNWLKDRLASAHTPALAGNFRNAAPGAHDYDMRDVSAFRAIVDAVATLFSGTHDLMRVVGPAPMGGEFIELVMEEAPLQRAMWL